MVITIEMSHYPLIEVYEGPIVDLITKLRSVGGLYIRTNAMSTYIQGEFDLVMEHVTEVLREVFEDGVPSSTVMKIIPRKLPVERGFMDF